jgi:hypothetical protein
MKKEMLSWGRSKGGKKKKILEILEKREKRMNV